jgi:DNA-binding transcriptional ArsR family regulator
MSLREQFDGHKICEALSDATRTKIFKYLLQEYPKARKISEIEKIFQNSISPTTVSFHLKKLREAGLVVTDGHKRGFRAVQKGVNISFNDNGFHIMGE